MTSQQADRPRILLVGAQGQVGWELLRTLAPLGNVVATARRTDSQAPELPACRPLDLTDALAIRSLVREVRPALVVNAAAYTAVDRAEQEPALAEAINSDAPGVLATEAAQLGAALVHYSTDYVFDGQGQQPHREDDPTGPLGVYGRTKLAGEERIRASGAAHLILRTSWVFAPRGHNFVRTMLRLGSERRELKVVCDQVGAPTSAAVLADLTARILGQARSSFAAFLAERGGTVHACCAGETNWHALAEEIFCRARALGWPLVVERVDAIATAAYPTPARRPLNSRLDTSRLAERFGLSAPPWPVALDDCLRALVAQAPDQAPG